MARSAPPAYARCLLLPDIDVPGLTCAIAAQCQTAAVRAADQATESTASTADGLCIGCHKTDSSGALLRRCAASGPRWQITFPASSLLWGRHRGRQRERRQRERRQGACSLGPDKGDIRHLSSGRPAWCVASGSRSCLRRGRKRRRWQRSAGRRKRYAHDHSLKILDRSNWDPGPPRKFLRIPRCQGESVAASVADSARSSPVPSVSASASSGTSVRQWSW